MANRRKKATNRAAHKKVATKTKTSAKRTYVDYTVLRIQPLKKASPRRASTKSGQRYVSMLKYLAKHRKATAKEVFKNTAYRADDAQWDKNKGNVKLVKAA